MGNSKSVFSMIGATNHSTEERADADYYATPPSAVEGLLQQEKFSFQVWEPACGELAISNVLKDNGYAVRSSDLYLRGHNEIEQLDFLTCNEKWGGDIVTNPPYSLAKEFVEKSLDVVEDGAKIAMLLRIQFLETKKRYPLFKVAPPIRIHVFVSRVNCGKNGIADNKQSALCYAWFVWEKGFQGHPTIYWIE